MEIDLFSFMFYTVLFLLISNRLQAFVMLLGVTRRRRFMYLRSWILPLSRSDFLFSLSEKQNRDGYTIY